MLWWTMTTTFSLCFEEIWHGCEFIFVGNMTRNSITVYHFPLFKKLDKIQINNSWSYRIRWCVNACNKTGNSVMYMCAYLCGLSIGAWGCHIVIFFYVFFPFSFLLNDGEHVQVTNAATCKWHVICIAHNHSYL